MTILNTRFSLFRKSCTYLLILIYMGLFPIYPFFHHHFNCKVHHVCYFVSLHSTAEFSDFETHEHIHVTVDWQHVLTKYSDDSTPVNDIYNLLAFFRFDHQEFYLSENHIFTPFYLIRSTGSRSPPIC